MNENTYTYKFQVNFSNGNLACWHFATFFFTKIYLHGWGVDHSNGDGGGDGDEKDF